MSPTERAPLIMLRMGFPESEKGPFVMKLRVHILRQCEQGMVNRSGGTWRHELEGGEPPSHEERAKAMLSMDWAIDQGHCSRVELLDGHFRDHPLLWLGDFIRRLGCKLRAARTCLLRRKNPYV